ncbi:Caspase-like Protein [Tribolium castaneum]|uniref:Caspase-like Protein n=2 Tax=Tribolium castaneum TaxID=7070 RepID=D6WFK4_TRICA|nr:PREDICTED: caspase-1 [Tribolium castaneum]EFA01345.2 Caspase-like Protein [Tribolium castaneum]|eukprot:XP_967501.2 PREDICTED: caspase-1 [Tribolium castaneum]
MEESKRKGKDIPDNNHEGEKENNVENGHDNDQSDALPDAFGTKLISNNVVACMPAEKYATHYNMNHKNRGLALIFNHEVFDIHNLKPRTGTDQDRKNLEDVLRKLGFEVIVFQDLRYHDIERQIKQAAKYDHTDSDCLCISVLTHGDTGILYARDTQYKPDLLWSYFAADRCPSLAGKPKIFFLQACQGDKLDGGVILSRTETDGHLEIDSYRIPAQADFLVVYSTVKGYYSWRNTTRGSWFIQALCEELRNKGFDYDLGTILTFVSQRVAFDFESNCPDSPTMHQQKQIPCVMSMLTRLIQFTRVKEGLEENETLQKQEKRKNTIKGLFTKGK